MWSPTVLRSFFRTSPHIFNLPIVTLPSTWYCNLLHLTNHSLCPLGQISEYSHKQVKIPLKVTLKLSRLHPTVHLITCTFITLFQTIIFSPSIVYHVPDYHIRYSMNKIIWENVRWNRKPNIMLMCPSIISILLLSMKICTRDYGTCNMSPTPPVLHPGKPTMNIL